MKLTADTVNVIFCFAAIVAGHLAYFAICHLLK